MIYHIPSKEALIYFYIPSKPSSAFSKRDICPLHRLALQIGHLEDVEGFCDESEHSENDDISKDGSDVQLLFLIWSNTHQAPNAPVRPLQQSKQAFPGKNIFEFFIRPKSHHWLPLSVTHFLAH